jgi:CRP/FNR family transcriptional regulator, anaerobic regulatory protein
MQFAIVILLHLACYLYFVAYSMQFLKFLTQNFEASPEAVAFLEAHLKAQSLPKNMPLLVEGQVSDAIFYIEEGLARAFYEKDSKEITTLFAEAGDFIYSPPSFHRRTPSDESIELTEASKVVAIPYQVLHELYSKYPEMNKAGRILTEQYLLMYDSRVRLQRDTRPIVRLTAFMEAYPNIFSRASQVHIASYLGTTPETVSRFMNQKRKNLPKN